MMVQFLVPHVISLSESGYIIDVACSEVGGRFKEVENKLGSYTANIFKLDLRRSPISVLNIKGYRQLVKIVKRQYYDIIWTNEPVMGVATRMAVRKSRKRGTKVLYMAHGFHFFTGAPLLNWLVYYPIERIMALKTDVICTVNTEDYKRAKSFGVNRVEYIHGIGINTERLSIKGIRFDIRRELGLKPETFLVLSIGELNKNKNQKTIIKAISLLNNTNIHYLICGKGAEAENLQKYAELLGLKNNVHFLGYRTDVVDICSQSDVYAMPSFREGLPVSSLEAMYCGLPLITSNIRGLSDVNHQGINGYLYSPTDSIGFSEGIRKIYENAELLNKIGERNRIDVIPYTIENTKKEVLELITSI